jgi:hypothetical protein
LLPLCLVAGEGFGICCPHLVSGLCIVRVTLPPLRSLNAPPFPTFRIGGAFLVMLTPLFATLLAVLR